MSRSFPRQGSTEEWEIINTTADAHPIHIHLIQFQAINTQPYQAGAYSKDWEAAFQGGFNPGDGYAIQLLQQQQSYHPDRQQHCGWKHLGGPVPEG